MKIRSLRTRIALIACVLTASLAMAACSSGSTSSGSGSSGSSNKPLEGVTWGYGNVLDSSPTFKVIGDHMTTDGGALGAKMLHYDNNIDPATALSNVNLMIQQNASLIVDWAYGSDNVAISKRLEGAKKNCVAVNVPIAGCPFYNTDSAVVGKSLGEVAVKNAQAKGWNETNTTVLIVIAGSNSASDQLTAQNFYSVYTKSFPGMKQYEPSDLKITGTTLGNPNDGQQTDGKGTLDGAFKAVTQLLQTVPADRNLMIFANNDDMANGSLRAVAQANRTDKTMLVSQIGTADAIKQVASGGPWIAESAAFYDQWSRFLLAMGLAIRDAKKMPDFTPAPSLTITKDNVSQYFNNDGTSKGPAPLQEGASYLEPYLKIVDAAR